MEVFIKKMVMVLVMALVTIFPSMAEEIPMGGILKVATIGEPPSLDPMVSTANVTGTMAQHYYETLYALGATGKVVPLLAESLPSVSSDNKTYIIKLRNNVKFHNGQDMTSEDVVLSLKRWITNSRRGKSVRKHLENIETNGPYAVKIILKKPYSPVLYLMSMNTGSAVIMPKDHMELPLKKPIGTGPFKFVEHKPDQYIRLVKYEGYSPSPVPSDGLGGKRVAYLDEIHFLPVGNPNSRLAGMIAGTYHFADAISSDSFSRMQDQSNFKPVIFESFGWPKMFLNMKKGVLVNKKLRQAILAGLDNDEIMLAGQGSSKFYNISGSLWPKQSPWYSTRNVNLWNEKNAEKAKRLIKESGYDGELIRLLTSRQYEHHYRMALVIVNQLKKIGLNVEMKVSDWATLTTKRQKPGLWEMFITHAPFPPDPAVIGIVGPGNLSGWFPPKKNEIIDRFVSETNLDARREIWGEFQALFLEDVPMIKLGNFNLLTAHSKKLVNMAENLTHPAFWNMGIRK